MATKKKTDNGKFDISKLTLGEVDRVETISGLSVTQLGDDDKPKGKLLAALVFVAKRREQLRNGEKLTFTVNDAYELDLDEAYEIIGLGDEEEAEASSEGEDPKD